MSGAAACACAVYAVSRAVCKSHDQFTLHPSSPFLQIIEWYEEYAEEFFQTHTELGESLEIALALEQEVKQFEDSTQVSCSYRQYVNVCIHCVLRCIIIFV